jgi:hypothetical protein
MCLLRLGERPRQREDGPIEEELADVVAGGGGADRVRHAGIEPQASRDRAGHGADAAMVAIERRSERVNRRQPRAARWAERTRPARRRDS